MTAAFVEEDLKLALTGSGCERRAEAMEDSKDSGLDVTRMATNTITLVCWRHYHVNLNHYSKSYGRLSRTRSILIKQKCGQSKL